MDETVHPVILRVPESADRLDRRNQAAFLSQYARKALAASAEKTGVRLDRLDKAENGAPLPSNGFHWSVTHKPAYVGGVVAPVPIGLDIEEIRPVRDGMHARVGSPAEWALSEEDPVHLFFRFWTAKEAVLKAAGKGIVDLSRCLVRRVPGPERLVLEYGGRTWEVVQIFFDGYLASMVEEGMVVEWEYGPDLCS